MPGLMLPIAAMDDTTALFLFGYIAGVAISVFVLNTVPKSDAIPPDLQQTRTMIIVLGFLPCCWIGPVVQLGALASYKYRVGRLTGGGPAAPFSAAPRSRTPPPPPPGSQLSAPAPPPPPPAPPPSPPPRSAGPKPGASRDSVPAEEVACAECGRRLRPGAQFCPSCGTRV